MMIEKSVGSLVEAADLAFCRGVKLEDTPMSVFPCGLSLLNTLKELKLYEASVIQDCHRRHHVEGHNHQINEKGNTLYFSPQIQYNMDLIVSVTC